MLSELKTGACGTFMVAPSPCPKGVDSAATFPEAIGHLANGHSEAPVPEFQIMPAGSLERCNLVKTLPEVALVLQCKYLWVQFYGSEIYFLRSKSHIP